MSKYGEKSRKNVEKTMHEHKHQGKYKNKQQAVAVGLNKARQQGEDVPEK
jgi:hypothetical protein